MKAKRKAELTNISSNTRIKGELAFEGDIRIDSYVEGNIVSDSGLLFIGGQALIKGDIRAETVVIAGTVDGSIEALDYVEVAASGKITGNVFAPNVNFEPGSVFVGRCTIGSKPKVPVESLPEATGTFEGEAVDAHVKTEQAQLEMKDKSAETSEE